MRFLPFFDHCRARTLVSAPALLPPPADKTIDRSPSYVSQATTWLPLRRTTFHHLISTTADSPDVFEPPFLRDPALHVSCGPPVRNRRKRSTPPSPPVANAIDGPYQTRKFAVILPTYLVTAPRAHLAGRDQGPQRRHVRGAP